MTFFQVVFFFDWAQVHSVRSECMSIQCVDCFV